jgi:putative exporter of polyketide antibiotics
VIYLGLMLVNVVVPTGVSSARAYFNLDWITLLVMAIVAVIGIIVFLAAHRGREVGEHIIDTEAPGSAAEDRQGAQAEERAG